MDPTMATEDDITLPPNFPSLEIDGGSSLSSSLVGERDGNTVSSSEDDLFKPLRLRPVPNTLKRPCALQERNSRHDQQPKKRKPQEVRRCTSADAFAGEKENRIVEQMEKTNEILSVLVKRMKKTEDKIEEIERRMTSSCSSSSSTPHRQRKKVQIEVPLEVRRELRRVYAMLEEEEDDFDGWNIGPGITYKDATNQAIVSRLVREVKGLNSAYLTDQIKTAAYRFYRTKCEEESAKRRGISDSKKKSKRRHERSARKLQERKAAVMKMSFKSEKDKERWLKVMIPDIMSSEESEIEDGEEIITVRPLPWLSTHVRNFFYELDEQSAKDKSPQARRQTKARMEGSSSTRPMPTDSDDCLPLWLFK